MPWVVFDFLRIHRPIAAASVVLACAAVVALVAPQPLSAHDIPNDVLVHAFFKPEGQRLRVLLRVPLAAMRDLDYPRRGPSSSSLLDVARADSTLHDAATLWVGDFLDVYEEGEKLPYPRVASVRAALQSDQSFASYDAALAHVNGPRLPDDTEFVWTQGLLDILFEYPIRSDRSHFSINPRFGRLGIRTLTVLHVVPAGPDGVARAFELDGEPGIVQLDPRWHEAVRRFVSLGFHHVLDGADYVLFLLCLVLPVRRLRSFVTVVAAFSVGHSVTLLASAYGLAPDALWFPPLIETLIAASIVYLAIEDVVVTGTVGLDRAAPIRAAAGALDRRWALAFGFGLVYGFGYAFVLHPTLQFAGSHVLSSVLSFNLGIELGQLLVLAILMPILALAFRFVVAERMGVAIASALVAHTAWHWLADRWSVLRRFRIEWPAFDLAFWAAAMRWAMIAVALIGAYWLVGLLRRRPREREATAD